MKQPSLHWFLLTTWCLTLLPAGIYAEDKSKPNDHPLSKDRTGIRWVMPFKQALAKAKQEQRLLMIKPVAFGTTKSGCW